MRSYVMAPRCRVHNLLQNATAGDLEAPISPRGSTARLRCPQGMLCTAVAVTVVEVVHMWWWCFLIFCWPEERVVQYLVLGCSTRAVTQQVIPGITRALVGRARS